MTKKQNKRYLARKARRVLNSAGQFINKISGGKLHAFGYGSGISRAHVRDSSKED